MGGYAEFLAAIRDPRHREHARSREGVGGELDPERFDLDAVNRALGRARAGPVAVAPRRARTPAGLTGRARFSINEVVQPA